ncbi:MAG: hypothetical protein L0271_18260, partial [Gemmatimonadetes bacterium]|nr:hypothetical protein [Gemmatimonadota bacterium]
MQHGRSRVLVTLIGAQIPHQLARAGGIARIEKPRALPVPRPVILAQDGQVAALAPRDTAIAVLHQRDFFRLTG